MISIDKLHYHHLRKSILARDESKLGRTELLELRLRLARCSLGSEGCKPVDFANMFSTSVNEMTPVSLPERRAPAMADAGTAAVGTGEAGTAAVGTGDGGAGANTGAAGGGGPAVVKDWGPIKGVAGAEGEGDADSTTHIRCDRVATSLATVWARVE